MDAEKKEGGGGWRSALPRYKSHKVVEAAKIESVGMKGGGWALLTLNGPDWPGSIAIEVSQNWFDGSTAAAGSFEALTGGYYVRYEDGYDSWAPAEGFEEGYRLVRDLEGGVEPVIRASQASLADCLLERLREEEQDPATKCVDNAQMIVLMEGVKKRLFARDERRAAAVPGGEVTLG
jgi:hypothetical protein